MPFTSLTCWRYIDLNPVRAGMVAAPDAYSWSSYSRDALGEPSALVQPHGQYLALGATAEARCAAWREFCAEATDDRQIDELRACLQTGTPLGTERFRQAIELTLQRRVGVARRGRPRQEAAEAVGLSPKGSLDLGTGPSCLGQGPRKDAGLVHELMFSVEAQPAVGAASSPRRGVFQVGSGWPRQARHAGTADICEYCGLLRRGEGAAPTDRIGTS